MSQTNHQDPEGGNDLHGHHDHPQSTPNQPLQGESNFGDSSGPFFSIYSKAAEDEDNKMVERWQKDADGILIFTGLFSAAVAALLVVTVQDLRPNSQDTSAFYLGNIYQVLADPNATRAFIASPVHKPSPFSPPRYAIWVNSLWFLSLVISLTCALLATSLHQWSRRYLRVAQLARCSPEKRARMRAFFAEGVDKMHIPWAVEGLPTLLHLSVFLFFGGVGVFLFNINHDVFTSVISWIVLFSIVYGLITVTPIVWHDSPYYAPLSRSAWFLYAGMKYVFFKNHAARSRRHRTFAFRQRLSILRNRYHGWMLGGVEKAAEETVSKRSSEIDIRIFDWTLGDLEDDSSLEKFFEAIPGFFSSRLVGRLEGDFPDDILNRFWSALNRFMNRTLSSNLVIESVKTRRVTICKDIMTMIPCPFSFSYDALSDLFDQAPVSIDGLQAMARWRTHKNDYVASGARVRVAKNLAGIQKRDGDWIALASGVSGLAARDLRDNIDYAGDNLLLATLIDVSRRAIVSYDYGLVRVLTDFDICHTLPRLQRDFCTLWNEIVQEARGRGLNTIHVSVLHLIRHHYLALHQGTRAAPTRFSTSTHNFDPILDRPSSYPSCNIASHRPDSTIPNSHAVPLLTLPGDSSGTSPYPTSHGGGTVSQQAEQANIIIGPHSPSDPTTPGETGDSSQPPAATSPALPVHTSPRPTDTSPPGAVAAAPQDILPALSYILEGTPYAELYISDFLSTGPSTPAPTATLAPAAASAPASSPLSRVPPSPKAEFLSLLGNTPPSLLTSNSALPRMRARGLVNTGTMCFANAVLQLLVHSPPFWNLSKVLGDLKGQHGARGPETGSEVAPLVDATVRFFEEFVFKEKEPPLRLQSPQRAVGGKPREDEEAKKEHNTVDSFEPTYMYNVIKEKRQLGNLLDGRQQNAEEFFRLFLNALDEELAALHTPMNTDKPASSLKVEETGSGEGQSKVGDHTASSAKSPISRMFDGRSRSTVRAPNRPDTIAVEDWRLLQLNIQPNSVHTVEDALAYISQPQPVKTGQSSSSKASQQVLLEVLPPILVLHLERFLYDVAADGIVKIGKPVQFAPGLEIPLEIMAPVAGKSVEPAWYKLYGVLFHHGKSAGSGHYTVNVLHRNGDGGGGEGWLHIDDETVSVVRHEEVFGGHENERMDDRSAYMLFYCRTAPA